MTPRAHLRHEKRLWKAGLEYVAGVDEVGIGPLAGPVVAAAVVFPQTRGRSPVAGIRDSKTLTRLARERLDAQIRRFALAVGVGVVGVDEIDRINIYQSGLKAMRLAIDRLPLRPHFVFLDGRGIPDLDLPHRAFPGGDRRIYSVAAASIIAKVYRDRLMVKLHEKYPQYGFAHHVGYGTRAHRDALRRHGPCPAHRLSFTLL